jgi:hypothetical protein
MKTFNPNQFQLKLEKPFVPKPEAHFLVNEIAGKLISENPISEDDKNFIHDLFIELQNDSNREIVESLFKIRDEGFMNHTQLGIIGCYFMISHQIGPDDKGLLDRLISHDISVEDFKNITKDISIPEFTRNYIDHVYESIKSKLPEKLLEPQINTLGTI